MRARQPAGAGRVHRGHADAAGRVIVIVRQVRGVPIAPGCGRLLHRNHSSAVRRFARAAAPAIEHHPVQPIAARAAATRPPRSQVGLDDLPQHDSVFFSVRGNRFDVIGLAGAGPSTLFFCEPNPADRVPHAASLLTSRCPTSPSRRASCPPRRSTGARARPRRPRPPVPPPARWCSSAPPCRRSARSWSTRWSIARCSDSCLPFS